MNFSYGDDEVEVDVDDGDGDGDGDDDDDWLIDGDDDADDDDAPIRGSQPPNLRSSSAHRNM